jgi:hypothetical protein
LLDFRWRFIRSLTLGASAISFLDFLATLKPKLSAALPVLMTLVTVDTVVDIPGHVIVLEVLRVVAAMASGALEDGVVV